MGHREERRGLLGTRLRRGLGSAWPASLIGRQQRLRRRSLRAGLRIGRPRTGIKARRGRRRDWLVGPQRLFDRPQGQRGQTRLDDQAEASPKRRRRRLLAVLFYPLHAWTDGPGAGTWWTTADRRAPFSRSAPEPGPCQRVSGAGSEA
jgi:hypothetical protein